MNFDKKDVNDEETIREWLNTFANDIDYDLVGLWRIVSMGRTSFGLKGGDLREFVFLSVLTVVSRGACVLDDANDGTHYWKVVDRYGTRPEEIAKNVTAEWIEQGEIDPPPYDSLAFGLQSFVEGPENRLDWPKPDIGLER